MFLKGRGNQFSTYVAPINAKFDTFDQPRVGDHYTIAPELSQYIYTVFGVPKALAGDDSGTQYKTGEDVKTAFFQMTIAPLANHMQEFINYAVMPYLDSSGASFYFDTSEFDQVSEDDDKRSQIATRNYQAGLWTRNRALEYVNQEEISTLDFLQIDGVPVPLDKVPQYWEYKLTVRPNPNEAPALLQNNPIASQPVNPLPEPTKDVTQSCVIMLSLANNTDLIALQNRLKTYLGDTEVNWTSPDEYHITLCYAPAATMMQVGELTVRLAQMNAPTMQLTVGSFKAFDDMGHYALHFRIRQNADLSDYQQAVWDMLQAVGISTSSYSAPERYIPHITMGYAQNNPGAVTFDSKLTVMPSALQVADDSGIVKEWPIGAPQIVEGKAAQVSAEDELAAWEKKVKNKGHKAAFTPYLLRGDLGDWLVDALLNCTGENTVVKAIFNQAREKLAYKAIQATRLDFENAFDALLTEALAGMVTRRRFGTILRSLISRYGNKAYRDGLLEGGVDSEPDESEQEEITSLIREQSQYVTGLGDTLYKSEDEISEAMAQQKASMWFNGSIAPFFNAGRASSQGNQMMEFAGDDGVDSCPECQTLQGQRHRYKDWYRKNLAVPFVGQETTCQGFNCQHKLVPVSGKARGEWV
jgi:2'-5' RNA ligase